MKKLLWATVVILATITLVGCGRYTQEESIFVALNRSSDPVVAIVDGNEVFQMQGNSAGDFMVKIDVARRRVNDSYGPSQIDKLVQVIVTFKNLRTGRLSPDVACTAGAKVKTNIVYETSSSAPEGRASCSYSQTYGKKEEKGSGPT